MQDNEFTLKAGADKHNLNSNSPQQDAEKCVSTRAQVFKSEKLINPNGCCMDDIRAEDPWKCYSKFQNKHSAKTPMNT